jgi:hypothetical protein
MTIIIIIILRMILIRTVGSIIIIMVAVRGNTMDHSAVPSSSSSRNVGTTFPRQFLPTSRRAFHAVATVAVDAADAIVADAIIATVTTITTTTTTRNTFGWHSSGCTGSRSTGRTRG